jgi:hypothetical protein
MVPFLIVGGSILFWVIVGLVKKYTRSEIITYIVVTILILFFIAHPKITQTFLKTWE